MVLREYIIIFLTLASFLLWNILDIKSTYCDTRNDNITHQYIIKILDLISNILDNKS